MDASCKHLYMDASCKHLYMDASCKHLFTQHLYESPLLVMFAKNAVCVVAVGMESSKIISEIHYQMWMVVAKQQFAVGDHHQQQKYHFLAHRIAVWWMISTRQQGSSLLAFASHLHGKGKVAGDQVHKPRSLPFLNCYLFRRGDFVLSYSYRCWVGCPEMLKSTRTRCMTGMQCSICSFISRATRGNPVCPESPLCYIVSRPVATGGGEGGAQPPGNIWAPPIGCAVPFAVTTGIEVYPPWNSVSPPPLLTIPGYGADCICSWSVTLTVTV